MTRAELVERLRAAASASSNAEDALARSVDRLVDAAADTARCRERVAACRREHAEVADALMALHRDELRGAT